MTKFVDGEFYEHPCGCLTVAVTGGKMLKLLKVCKEHPTGVGPLDVKRAKRVAA